jgi:hypothetical protein
MQATIDGIRRTCGIAAADEAPAAYQGQLADKVAAQ